MDKQIAMVNEFNSKLPKSSDYAATLILRHKLLSEEVNELLVGTLKQDRVEIADAIADCIYVLLGTAIEYDVADKLTEIFAEVHRSNMTKFTGVASYTNGKLQKGPYYTPPDIEAILGPERSSR